MKKEIFKAYDIRGIYPSDINADDVNNIAKAYATWLKPKKVALGRDVRVSGAELWQAACDGLTEMGVDVVDIGVISTDMLYFSVANYGLDGGMTISASHNAAEYNGIKMVRALAAPISIDNGIAEIRDMAMSGKFQPSATPGKVVKLDISNDYLAKMVSFGSEKSGRRLKVVANANFGASGKSIAAISKHFGVKLTELNFEQDGSFPKGKPDPTQVANRLESEQVIKSSPVDFGAIWDADADRCFFYDEKGNYILPIYITGLLMDYILPGIKGETVVIDPRNVWLPIDVALDYECKIAVNKSGHSFIKERMKRENAIFGAENSAHYYFRDFWYADNGMIPFVMMINILSATTQPLSELVAKYMAKSVAIEETNFRVKSVPETIEYVSGLYPGGNRDNIDGVSIEYEDWRLNLRGSNTEPLIRLNIEAKTPELATEKLNELAEVLNGQN
jgi:phosphomannomutase